jgi:DNA polymerase (family 10)
MKTPLSSTQELAKMFFEFGYYDEMQGIPFKPRAYEIASESMAALGHEVKVTWKRGGIKALKELPGVGESIAEKIDEYFRTGKVKAYVAMKKKFPVDMWGLAKIEGMGPIKIRDLYKHLKIKNLNDLEHALKAHKIRALPRFGEQSEDKIARGLALMQHASGRRLLGEILPIADAIVAKLSKIPGVKRCVYAGSLRRRKETVGDIDLLATSTKPEQVTRAFTSLPEVQSIHESGKTRASVRLAIGIDADLRVVPDEVYGAALQYFTGNKRHNVLLREYALHHGYTLSEYGLFKLARGSSDGAHTVRPDRNFAVGAHGVRPDHGGKKAGKLIACKTEDDIYKRLGMDTPPPEIRIGDEEINAAREHRLPNLIPYGSVKGDLHVHTNATDGSASLEGMVTAAKRRGLDYIAVTDHSKALAFINGLDANGVAKQGRAIDAFNKKRHGFRVLKGTECDIRSDGTLDLSNEALAKLDWVGVSVHSSFHLSRAEQTKRVIRAISNPNVDCLCHPTGALIGKREAIDLDMDAVIAAAKKYRIALEIDCYPDRSDLNAIHIRAAVRAGVMLAIDTDAHAPEHLDFIPLGEALARRGWATKKDVLNTKSLKDLLSYLNKKQER